MKFSTIRTQRNRHGSRRALAQLTVGVCRAFPEITPSERGSGHASITTKNCFFFAYFPIFGKKNSSFLSKFSGNFRCPGQDHGVFSL